MYNLLKIELESYTQDLNKLIPGFVVKHYTTSNTINYFLIANKDIDSWLALNQYIVPTNPSLAMHTFWTFVTPRNDVRTPAVIESVIMYDDYSNEIYLHDANGATTAIGLYELGVKLAVKSSSISYGVSPLMPLGISAPSPYAPSKPILPIGINQTLDNWAKASTPATEASCDHEWIDVGFRFSKYVCKKCNIEI